MEIVQELANQLGVAVENLLSAYAPYYLGANIGSVVTSFVCLVIGFVLSVFFLKTMIKNYNTSDNYLKCDDPNVWVYGIIAGIMVIVVIISLAVFAMFLPRCIGAIMSPTGAAIADIVSKVMG